MPPRQNPSPRPYIPALASIYDPLAWLAWPLVRVTAGALLVPHGSQKLFGWFGGGGMGAAMEGFAAMGFAPFWAWVIALLEFFGGILLVVGFLTRLVAGLVVCFMATAVFVVHWPNGFFWTAGGIEYPLMWGLVALALVLRGAGPLSLDAALGREL